ncbi:protease [Skermanella stibiiresistens SB22]|uniref:Zinc metalloprotease n=1 Tax=Skermanella stibiiresistens SB22 TaxID=1385369 RepID=W9GXE0_9PROT|nr:site-2 protease family protein [Skermanella stibiiresistens]EWY36123.1 protease [Skermanella stibiiresistens SB22]
MGWSIPIGTVKGTVIRIHVTFLLFLIWIGGMHYAQGGAPAALEGVVFIVLLFACVLLHEFGHVFAARRYGVRTPDITLLPIGGVARLERIPEKPSQELVIALAGPAVNVVIAALLYAALAAGGFNPGLTPGSPLGGGSEIQNPAVGMLERLAWVNVFLVVFNLIPAFPMDGGRVLRALLAQRMGYGRGTAVAATIGQGVAFALGLLGLFGNPMLLFIALFVYLAASSEAHAVQIREVSRGVMANDAMITRFESLSPGSVVEDAVQCLIHTTQHEFPVVDGSGRLRGVLTRDDMIRALRDRGPDTPVLEVMRSDIPVIGQRQNLEEALRLMRENSLPAVGVTDADGRLIGLITPENVGEMMMIQSAWPKGRAGGGPGGGGGSRLGGRAA